MSNPEAKLFLFPMDLLSLLTNATWRAEDRKVRESAAIGMSVIFSYVSS